MKKINENVLPKIVLKYYKKPKDNDKSIKSGITCAWCLTPDVVNIGGGFRDEKGISYQICERCATYRYKSDYGYKTLIAAKSRRRRIFDVGYLFNELLIDIYMSKNNILSFKDFNEADDLFIKASELYNLLFSKDDKIILEEKEDQKKIEEEFRIKLSFVDLDKFFSQIK